MGKRASILGGLLLLLLAAGAGSAAAEAPASGASARAFAIKVVVPGYPEIATGLVSAPSDATASGDSFAYPGDGSVVSAGPLTSNATAGAAETSAAGSAATEVTQLSLFGGEITATSVRSAARAQARNGRASGDLSATTITELVVLGQPVEPQPALRVALADWGYAIVLAEATAPSGNGFRGFVTALEVHLNLDHGGLPAGSAIFIGHAEAAAVAASPPPPKRRKPTKPPPPVGPVPSTPDRTKATAPRDTGPVAAGERRTGRNRGSLVRPIPDGLAPKLTRKGYVFPVHGPASFTDTFGAPRAVVDWHHGEDIFAPIGAPILAVARGTVFSVGWNDLGGNRLWLRDIDGNEFYYAHLSAFSPLAVDGARVQAGDVLGFVGNSGDAESTPPHLHFEIHPVGLLGLGYEGVISPYRYLLAWRHLEDVRFVAGAGWIPFVPESAAPQPGAFLLSSEDISSVSGLEPGSLRRALTAPRSAEAPSR